MEQLVARSDSDKGVHTLEVDGSSLSPVTYIPVGPVLVREGDC